MFQEILWPYTMVSVAAKGSIWWVCDPSLGSYALEQPEMLRSLSLSQVLFASTVFSWFLILFLNNTRKPKVKFWNIPEKLDLALISNICTKWYLLVHLTNEVLCLTELHVKALSDKHFCSNVYLHLCIFSIRSLMNWNFHLLNFILF